MNRKKTLREANVMTRLLYITAVAALLGGIMGCVAPGQGWIKTYQTSEPFFTVKEVKVVEANYDAADAMADRLAGKIPRASPIYASPFVNIENDQDASPFGIVVGEQVADRLTQHGWTVKTGRAPAMAPPVPEDGGDALVPVSLSGTYIVSEGTVFLSCRVVRAEDSTVIEGEDWTMPGDSDLGALLTTDGSGGLTPTVHTQFIPAEQEPQTPAAPPRRPAYMHPAPEQNHGQGMQEMNEMNILQP